MPRCSERGLWQVLQRVGVPCEVVVGIRSFHTSISLTSAAGECW